jgi:fused signal recognition particle receptor
MSRLLRRAGDIPKRSLWQRIKDVALADVNVLARGGVREGSLERLEELLIEADFGVPVTLRLVEEVALLAQRGAVRTEEQFQEALRTGITEALRSGNSDPAFRLAAVPPTVIVVVGVNGAGKTTFIGKLSARARWTSCGSGPSAPVPISSAGAPEATRRPWRSTPLTPPPRVSRTRSSLTPRGGCTRAMP